MRELKSLNIDVYFEEEHLNTLSSKGEFLLSILAARAQEESRSASENQKWRIRKKYEKGEPINGNALGYRLVDGTFWIDEEEEKIVLRIFSMYLAGMGRTAIAKQLNEEGVPTRLNKAQWHPCSIYAILTNDKYQGDLTLQKSYCEDYLSKKQVKNRGERPIYKVANAHDPIVSRETYEQVQAERVRRAEKFNPTNGTLERYPFTGMIICEKCGHHYRRRTANAGTQYAKPAWVCSQFLTFGKKACDAQQIPESILTAKTCEVLGLTELDDEILKDKIAEILIPERNVLIYKFRDGTEQRVQWQHRSRKESWTPEMKEHARQQMKKRLEEKKRC